MRAWPPSLQTQYFLTHLHLLGFFSTVPFFTLLQTFFEEKELGEKTIHSLQELKDFVLSKF